MSPQHRSAGTSSSSSRVLPVLSSRSPFGDGTLSTNQHEGTACLNRPDGLRSKIARCHATIKCGVVEADDRASVSAVRALTSSFPLQPIGKAWSDSLASSYELARGARHISGTETDIGYRRACSLPRNGNASHSCHAAPALSSSGVHGIPSIRLTMTGRAFGIAALVIWRAWC